MVKGMTRGEKSEGEMVSGVGRGEREGEETETAREALIGPSIHEFITISCAV